MTEAELVESSVMYYGHVADMLSIYLTVTMGFLVAAYLVGGKLSSSQLMIISTLYVIFALTSSYMVVASGLRGVSYIRMVGELNSDTKIYASGVVPVVIGFCLFGGIAACLKFMWDVRHPGAE